MFYCIKRLPYNDKITSLAVSGTTTKTLPQQSTRTNGSWPTCAFAQS